MPDASGDLPTDDYILGRTSEEYQRLRWQARLWEPTTARVLDRAGVAAGMRCLDVGCGPGEVMRLLAERVGPAGQVTGVDNDGRLGREALGVLRATLPDPDRFAFVEADVETAETIPGQPFDLVYARLLLSHLRDPVAALRKLGGWVRPGGIVVVQDFDAHTVAVWPELASWGEFERVIAGTYEKTGRDLRLGSKLPLHFAAAGLGEPDGTDVAGLLLPAAELGLMYQGVYRSLLPIALRLGVTTEADSQAFLAEIAEVCTRRSHVVLSPLLVGVWKRRERP
ncbi:MAG TPA: class I SAM-dependent methyltransferase [Actinomycetes bacterium]